MGEPNEPSHEQLALGTMAVLTIFGMPARNAAMRDYRWGREITRLEDGDYQFEVGTPGGTKSNAYCKFLLSDLNGIGQTGLLRPDLVATRYAARRQQRYRPGVLPHGRWRVALRR